MSDTQNLPHDWAIPDWQSARKVHDWKNYAGDELRALWPTLTPDVKRAVAMTLDAIAADERWD